MLVELSMDDLIRLFRLTCVGKLVGGLIHNLNGPLQNLGLDLEMAIHTLKIDSLLDEGLKKDIQSRLIRMQEEYERIDQLIKISSLKADADEDYHRFLHFNNFLNQELEFFKTNLYFKHNVHTELELQDNLPSTSNLSKDFFQAFSWFLQAVIEELESREIKVLTLKTSSDDPYLKIVIATEEGNLSENFMAPLNQAMPASNRLRVGSHNVGMVLALQIFNTMGITVTNRNDATGSIVTLTIPIGME